MRVRAVAGLLCLVLAGCSGDDSAPAAATPEPAAVRYDSLEAVAEAADCTKLVDVGTGGNAGLEEFGVCYVGSANIDIYLTSQRGLWEHIGDQFPSVLGPNWVIVSPSGVEGALIIQERLGGELKLPPTATPE